MNKRPWRRGLITRCFGSRNLVMIIGVLLFSCNGSLGQPNGPGVPAEDGGVCVDEDRDGYGVGCLAGADCDDSDAAVHVGCSGTDGDADGDGPPGIGAGPVGEPFGDEGDRTSWDPTPDNSSNVMVNEDGELILDSNFVITPAVWISNDEEGTVSRLDVDTGRELGRYPAIISGRDIAADPSRTAVDFRGDCWVSNRYRSTGSIGSVTKIASHIEDCVDRDGDGEIQTSQDLDGDGVISLGTDEFLNGEDECVLFTVGVGEAYGIPRALAIAPDPRGNSAGGNAWVGMNHGERNHEARSCAEIDGDTGAILRYVALPLNPYGALASKFEGQVWFTNAGWQSDLPDNPPSIVSVNYRTGEVSPRYEVEANGCVGTYGITIDMESRVWVSGHSCTRAFRFDPRTAEWMTVELGENGTSRGLVADAEGRIWVAHSGGCGREQCGVVSRFNAEDGSEFESYFLPNGAGTIGVDVDINGRIWVVNKATDSTSRIDPVTGVIDEYPTGDGPYTYSDFTGHSLLLQFPRGYYRDVIEACPGAQWAELLMDARTPEGTSVEVRVRTGENQTELMAADWIGSWTSFPADLQAPPGPVPDGAMLEVELTLITTGDNLASPAIRSLDFTYTCPLM